MKNYCDDNLTFINIEQLYSDISKDNYEKGIDFETFVKHSI